MKDHDCETTYVHQGIRLWWVGALAVLILALIALAMAAESYR